jgi:hypothetical protein
MDKGYDPGVSPERDTDARGKTIKISHGLDFPMRAHLALATGILMWTASLHTATALDPQAGSSPGSSLSVDRPPRISPDYADITLPPNIASLNFTLHEPGQRYLVRIRSTQGREIEIASRSAEIRIPPAQWSALLAANVGRPLLLDVKVQDKAGTWSQYRTVTNTIAADKIDRYLVYRFMMPSSYFPKRMRICQRDIEGFGERVLLDTRSFGNGCAHCHSFAANAPDPMVLGIRSTAFPSATLYAHGGQVDRIAAKFGYTAWHPSGRVVAYSINDVRQFFHAASTEIHDVVDMDSAIVYYDVAAHQVRTVPALSDKLRLETYPTWTPDGKTLYFCSAPLTWTDKNAVPPKSYKQIRYDLMRIGYDVETDTWGPLETVLAAQQTGHSILLPRVSPDGRFLLFCMTDYGCFPVFQPSSDLYLMDLRTARVEKPPINSDAAEGWHAWSSNSRWIVFSSKRQAGLFTRPYLSYVDERGTLSKPFVLPQEDPSFYESSYFVYSIPEFLARPVTVSSDTLLKAVLGPAEISVNAVTGATPKPAETYTGGQGIVQ